MKLDTVPAPTANGRRFARKLDLTPLVISPDNNKCFHAYRSLS